MWCLGGTWEMRRWNHLRQSTGRLDSVIMCIRSQLHTHCCRAIEIDIFPVLPESYCTCCRAANLNHNAGGNSSWTHSAAIEVKLCGSASTWLTDQKIFARLFFLPLRQPVLFPGQRNLIPPAARNLMNILFAVIDFVFWLLSLTTRTRIGNKHNTKVNLFFCLYRARFSKGSFHIKMKI